jgi:hypothetical protein
MLLNWLHSAEESKVKDVEVWRVWWLEDEFDVPATVLGASVEVCDCLEKWIPWLDVWFGVVLLDINRGVHPRNEHFYMMMYG